MAPSTYLFASTIGGYMNYLDWLFQTGSGPYLQRMQASPTLVLPQGFNPGHVSVGPSFKVHLALFDDGGTLRLAVFGTFAYLPTTTGQIIVQQSIIPITESGVASAVSMPSVASDFGVFYANATITSKPYRYLGVMEFDTPFSTLGNWIAPTRRLVFTPGMQLPGAVVGSKTALSLGFVSVPGSAIIPYDNTNPQITEGTFVLNVPYSMKNKANLLKVEANIVVSTGAVGGTITAAIFQDSIANNFAANSVTTPALGNILPIVLEALLQPNVLGNVTPSLRAGPSTNIAAFVGGAAGNDFFNGTQPIILRATEIQT